MLMLRVVLIKVHNHRCEIPNRCRKVQIYESLWANNGAA